MGCGASGRFNWTLVQFCLPSPKRVQIHAAVCNLAMKLFLLLLSSAKYFRVVDPAKMADPPPSGALQEVSSPEVVQATYENNYIYYSYNRLREGKVDEPDYLFRNLIKSI